MKTVGIVGGGQLGRMLGMAAKALGFEVVILDPTPKSPAGLIADRQIVGDFKDAEKIKEIAELADYITFEIESANAQALEELAEQGHIIHPSPATLSIIKDKYSQKKFLEKHGIPVADSVAVETIEDIFEAAENFDYPLLLKARYDAYDGRGNALVRDESEIAQGIEKLKVSPFDGTQGRKLYIEQFVPFVKELAVVVARATDGTIIPYPPVETIHKNNICHIVMSPAKISKTAYKNAEALATKVMSHLNGVGVFCVEMFLTADDHVLVNEIAPRVHNSGHHSIEAHKTSQFEQHIRAVTGMQLGSIERTSPCSVMINILGERTGPAEPKGHETYEKSPDTFIHIYGKTETRPERKMGHITIIDDDPDRALEKAQAVRNAISI